MYFRPCKRCGARIAFYQTCTGKYVPVEEHVKQITVDTCRAGQRPIKVIDGRGRIYTGGVIDRDDGTYPVVKGWVLHFGRCITDAMRKAERRRMLEEEQPQQVVKEIPSKGEKSAERTSCRQLDLFKEIM